MSGRRAGARNGLGRGWPGRPGAIGDPEGKAALPGQPGRRGKDGERGSGPVRGWRKVVVRIAVEIADKGSDQRDGLVQRAWLIGQPDLDGGLGPAVPSRGPLIEQASKDRSDDGAEKRGDREDGTWRPCSNHGGHPTLAGILSTDKR